MSIEVFDFSTTLILENERVLLRPLEQDDNLNLADFSINEPELWKYSLASGAGTSNLQTYIQKALEGRKAEKEYPFIIFDKASQRYAGSTRFYDIQLNYQTLQLGYTWYGKSFQGSGLNKHCKYLLLSFAFEKLNVERVEFRADASNIRSIAAMKSIGCTVEGVLRSHLPKRDGGRRDSIVLSILKEEWNSNIKQTLIKKLE